MNPSRLILLALGAASVTWSAAALYAHSVHVKHQGMVLAIRNEEQLPTPEKLDEAIASYERAVRLLPCRMALHEDLGILLALRTDTALNAPDVTTPADALDTMRDGLGALLSCTPTDGKAWLDLAMLDVYREGFTKRSMAAYAMSGRVAPGESWLAEKRMLFALQFQPLLDGAARNVVKNDLETLARAHPNRMKTVMEAASVTSPEALYSLFAITKG